MKVALLTGISPPGACGVGDYTRRLAVALRSLGVETELVSVNRWRLLDVAAASKALDKLSPDVVHLQYPMPGAGYRLGPQVLALKRRTIATIHEASQSHFLRKLSLYPFTFRADYLIFTSDYEREFVKKLAPWIARISSVIPIGSNIDAAESLGQPRSREEIAYFGLIMPKKGLEDVVGVAKLIKDAGSELRVRIIGKPSPGHEAYLEHLRQESKDLPLVWETGLDNEQVAARLAGCAVGYLPFPDGVSERRASLKAMLLNGVAVVTTRGAHASSELEQVVQYSKGPRDAFEMIRLLLEDPSKQYSLGRKGFEYMQQFAWSGIAELHLRVYERVMRERISDPSLLCPN
jgi:glycosyltransferase involved in cell wall biosynthesis